ncbi:MAG: hypothetical protein KC912_08570 [Proteobacteria bacterium]|nr:hypothetical protein [Pseudomonadota bacterium]
MEIEELDASELQVFADLVVQMMLADGEISFDELRELDALCEEFGEAFRVAAEAAREKTREQAIEGLSVVVLQSSRDRILTMLYDMAATDGLDDSEREFLETVRSAWTFSW